LEILSKDAEEKQEKAMSRDTQKEKKQEINILHLPPIGLYIISPSRQDCMSGTQKTPILTSCSFSLRSRR
jgi:hypothetical protein